MPADNNTIQRIFDKINDISDQLARIDERTEQNIKDYNKLDECVGDVKRAVNAMQIEMGKLDVKLTLKTGFVAVVCGMIPPAVTMLILFLTGWFSNGCAG